eukprot:TRINITY_DN65471_c1_g1_i1.p1 TRINITY_DN65471_c1_g1~~TRINITY_DN65471_c1_g1_i1.p1  ORF type:complete len:180 (+),score=3.66 TRINITY_DN65471_c1_g1_i1:42-581(+)
MSSSSPSKEKNEIAQMSQAEEKFINITKKMTQLDISVDPSNPKGLINTQNQLNEIIKDLENFAIECKNNGDSERIPSLNKDIQELLSQTHTLYGHISKQVKAMDRYEDEEESYDELELNREEIVKLFLLTSKAYKNKQIDEKQKGFIKDRIIHRDGYLRKIMQQEELGVPTLATFASLP